MPFSQQPRTVFLWECDQCGINMYTEDKKKPESWSNVSINGATALVCGEDCASRYLKKYFDTEIASEHVIPIRRE